MRNARHGDRREVLGQDLHVLWVAFHFEEMLKKALPQPVQLSWLESTAQRNGVRVGEQPLAFCLHMNSPCTSLRRTFGSGTRSLVPPQKPCWRCLVNGGRSLVLPFHNWDTRDSC